METTGQRTNFTLHCQLRVPYYSIYVIVIPYAVPCLEGGVPVEVHQALQAAMEKLQQRFTSLMQEKADLKERVEELEHRCIQLSGETDTIGETEKQEVFLLLF